MFNTLATTLILATEAGSEGGSGVDLLIPAIDELIAGIIAFSVIAFFVWKWALPTLNETLEKRSREIKGQFEAAEEANQQAEALRKDYRAQLAQAREEAGRIVEDARQTGESARQDIVAKAQDEATAIKDRAAAKLEGERERVAGQLRSRVAGLSLDVAEKVVGRSMDRAAQRELVDQFIDDLGGVDD